MNVGRVALVCVFALLALLATANLVLHPSLAGVPLLLIALLALVLAGWERTRYRPAAPAGDFQPTGERFVDPTTGRSIVVYYDARTGKRDYRSASP